MGFCKMRPHLASSSSVYGLEAVHNALSALLLHADNLLNAAVRTTRFHRLHIPTEVKQISVFGLAVFLHILHTLSLFLW